MQEKDIIEKHLENYEDVFIDVINVLLFRGKKVLQGEILEQSVTQSFYSLEGNIHGQDRDIAKYWLAGNVRVAFLGIENQSQVDKYMPMRVIGYDGAVYRGQLLEKEKKKCYPVITLVLYFGYKKRWKNHKYLHECFKIPEELRPYINDYKINLFEIAYLSKDEVALFQSDFRIIADYFVQMRIRETYIPNRIKMAHPYETMRLLSVLTKDCRFSMVCEKNAKGGMTMCEVLDRVEQRGFKAGEKRGERRGEKRGEKRGRFIILKELVESGTLTVSEAAKHINMSEENFRNKMSLCK